MPPDATTTKQDPLDTFFAKRDSKSATAADAPAGDKVDPLDAFFSARDATVATQKAKDAADVETQAVANTKKLVLPTMEPSVIGKVASVLPGNAPQLPPKSDAERAALAGATERANPNAIDAKTGLPTDTGRWDQFSEAVNKGPQNVKVPGVGKTVSQLTQEASKYLNDPSVAKTRGQAFWKGVKADSINTINDMFLSPLGLTASALGASETIALSRAGKLGGEALKLAQDYEAMRAAGASTAELGEVANKMKQAIATTAEAQKLATVGKVAGQGAAGGFGAQGATSVVDGVKEKNPQKIVQGAAQILLGAAALHGAARAGGAEEAVKGETAARVAENAPEAPVATRTPQLDATAEPTPEPQPGVPAIERARPAEKAVAGAETNPVAVGPVAPTKPDPLDAFFTARDATKSPVAGRTDLAAESGAPLPTAVQPVESAPQAGAAATPERRSQASVGTPPEGTPERRLAPGPPPEQNRLLMEYRRKLNAPGTTPEEKSVLESQIADISGTEGALRIGGGGEEMAQQIRAARNAPVAPKEITPEVRADATQEIRAASDLASTFERPGRYFAGIPQTEQGIPQRSQSSEKGIQAGGVWYGVGSARNMIADQYPWFGQIKHGPGKLAELAAKGKGAEYERLVQTVAEHIQREKESAAPVMAEFAPQLKSLADEIDGHDLELSDTLTHLANADGRGFTNLRQYVEQKVTDATQAAQFYRLVDAAAKEAREASVESAPRPSSEVRKETGAGQQALPGLESAIKEQKTAAETVRGEKLTEEAKRPLGNIDQAAGEMESKSPLFRGTGASPQKEIFGNEALSAISKTIAASETSAGQTVKFQGRKGTIHAVRGNKVGFQPRGGETIQYLDSDAQVEPVAEKAPEKPAPTEAPEKPSLIGVTAHSNPLFDPEVWKASLGYLKPSGAAGQPNLRARTGELARNQAVLQEKLKKERARWRGRSDADMLAFADLVENGEADRKARAVTLTPKTQALLDKGKKSLTAKDHNLAQTMRALLDEGRTTVQGLGTGKLQNFIENYFPHIWEQKGTKIGAALGQILGKRPLEGGKSFLKKREIPTMAEGFDKDLKPVTTNPVDMAILKMHEMNRYVMAHRVLEDLKAAGTAKFVRFGGKAPEGWRQLDDKVFQVLQYSETDKGMINRGRYYAPEEVATPINRYVASGLKGIPIYDLLRAFGNSLNQLQLGLSGFHLGTTSLNAIISQFALATKQAARGQLVKAAGNMLAAPAAPLRNLIQGGSVAKSYLRPDQAKKYTATAKAVEEAGGRIGMGEEYIDNRIEKMLQSFANKKYFTGILQSIPAAVEAQAIPVLKWTVPRMKLGAFHDLAADILDRAQKKGWNEDKIRSELQKSWDSIDNRFGQVVYDNLNWNKVAKDLAFIGVRSVGWNYGTWRELGGGAKDTAAQAGKFLNGKGFEVTDRMAYTFMLPLTIAALGALYMYAHTGKGPQTAKDYFYPKNGKLEEDGTEARSSLPSYMKDVFAVSKHPVNTALHKINPALSVILEMVDNKDFYGNEIRNSDDPAMAQLWQAVAHIGKSFLPFTLRTAQKQKELGEKGIEPKVETFLGITPAPRAIERSDAETLAHDLIQRRAPAGAHTTAEQQKRERIFQLEQGIRDKSLTVDALKKKLAAGEITKEDLKTVATRITTPGLVRQFKELSVPEALKVWEVASPKERTELRVLLAEKAAKGLPKMTREDMTTYLPLVRQALSGKKPPENAPIAKFRFPFMNKPTAKPTAEMR